jgi:flavin reductase (DIM6/NTAB) family NADH-FMN oxidoreductase RutF/rubrerythrin
MKKWKCTVCGYIAEGLEPPDECPVCHAPKEAFVEIEAESPASAKVEADVKEEKRVEPVPSGSKPSAVPVVPGKPTQDQAKNALYSITYGMFVVSSRSGEKVNAQTCNTVFQITSDPARLAIGINKSNLTYEFIMDSKVLAVTILGKGNMGIIKRFGFSSGRNVDKFAGVEWMKSPEVGCPVISDGNSYLECEIELDKSIDAGTHTLFVAKVLGGGKLQSTEPITYGYYRANRSKPGDIIDDVDWNNVIAALNLEFGANRRYQYQITQLSSPGLTTILEGIMRTEGDHVDSAVAYLEKRLAEKLPDVAENRKRELLFMILNQDFEEVARDTYMQFARETRDEALKEMFTDQAQSEHGHVNIFKGLVNSLKDNSYPVAFFCPLCGWEIAPEGSEPVGQAITCPQCGARFQITGDGISFGLKRV